MMTEAEYPKNYPNQKIPLKINMQGTFKKGEWRVSLEHGNFAANKYIFSDIINLSIIRKCPHGDIYNICKAFCGRYYCKKLYSYPCQWMLGWMPGYKRFF